MVLEDVHCISDYRHIDFLEHLGPSASVQQSDVLRRRHDDSTWKHGHVRHLQIIVIATQIKFLVI